MFYQLIPDEVTKIESKTFYACTSLKTVVVHNTLTSIAPDTFRQSAVKDLIFICQDKDNMEISEDVVDNVASNINIYRIAADEEIKTNYSEIKSYE